MLLQEEWPSGDLPGHLLIVTSWFLISSKDELIDNGEEKTFDMAYIDADKWNYHVYYDKCIQLVRKGGVILMDDVRITQ